MASDYLPRGITVINHGVVIQPDLGLIGKWNASVGYTYWNLGRTTAALPLAEGRHYRNVVYTSVGLAF